MGKVIVVTSGDGGVGKTTATPNLRTIELLQNARIELIRLILNRFSPQLAGNGRMMDQGDVFDTFDIDLIGVVPEDNGIITSINRRIPVVYDDGSPGAQAYMRIARRLTGQRMPFF